MGRAEDQAIPAFCGVVVRATGRFPHPDDPAARMISLNGGADNAAGPGRFSEDRTPCDCATWRCHAIVVAAAPPMTPFAVWEKRPGSASVTNAVETHRRAQSATVDGGRGKHTGSVRSGEGNSCIRRGWRNGAGNRMAEG